MAPLSFDDARKCVLTTVLKTRKSPACEHVPLEDSDGRVLAEDQFADRDYPPLARSVRDGYAVRAADFPGRVRVIGEVRAGDRFEGEVHAGECVEIMTGAPLPEGADSIVMVEHAVREGEGTALSMTTDRPVKLGEFINRQGVEASKGSTVLRRGQRIGHAQVAMLATIGCTMVPVFVRPRVAILATGDEIVDVGETPLEHQIRNSNAYSLAVQVRKAGGVPVLLRVARDNFDSTRKLVSIGLEHDLLLLSGGVSAGKYDIVESVLAEFGAEFFFDRVLIQPGQPLVFGRAQNTPFFGLPGNPASTMVTFEIFARAALELLAGEDRAALPMMTARLAKEFRQRPGLTRFLPACLSDDGAEVTPMPWSGSGDVPALARANAYLVTDPERESWQAGEPIRVLVK